MDSLPPVLRALPECPCLFVAFGLRPPPPPPTPPLWPIGAIPEEPWNKISESTWNELQKPRTSKKERWFLGLLFLCGGYILAIIVLAAYTSDNLSGYDSGEIAPYDIIEFDDRNPVN